MPEVQANQSIPSEEVPSEVPEQTIADEKASVYGIRPKTTWVLKPKAEMTVWEYICSLDIHTDETVYQRKPNIERGPPPVHPLWKENLWILTRSSVPLLIHTAWNWAVPAHKLHWASAWMLYHVCFIVYSGNMLRRLHSYMTFYGTFDEQNRGRDIAADADVQHLGRAIFFYTIWRTAGAFLFTWRGEVANPLLGLSWLTPFKIGAWQIALDFFFYMYHRSCHEIDGLWFIHRHHHKTKHPSPVLAILAGDIQEVIEIFICPLLATLTTQSFFGRYGFAEMWLIVTYTIYVETLGHSGVRAEFMHPVLGAPLRLIGCDLMVEDHDLHHRFGKSGKNYGKQTRIWDKLFGTVGVRIESRPT